MDTIINPENGESLYLYSREGLRVLDQYMIRYKGGASTDGNTSNDSNDDIKVGDIVRVTNGNIGIVTEINADKYILYYILKYNNLRWDLFTNKNKISNPLSKTILTKLTTVDDMYKPFSTIVKREYMDDSKKIHFFFKKTKQFLEIIQGAAAENDEIKNATDKICVELKELHNKKFSNNEIGELPTQRNYRGEEITVSEYRFDVANAKDVDAKDIVVDNEFKLVEMDNCKCGRQVFPEDGELQAYRLIPLYIKYCKEFDAIIEKTTLPEMEKRNSYVLPDILPKVKGDGTLYTKNEKDKKKLQTNGKMLDMWRLINDAKLGMI